MSHPPPISVIVPVLTNIVGGVCITTSDVVNHELPNEIGSRDTVRGGWELLQVDIERKLLVQIFGSDHTLCQLMREMSQRDALPTPWLANYEQELFSAGFDRLNKRGYSA